MKLGQSVANGGAAAAAILSLSLSPCPPPPPARGELLPLRVRSCVSAVVRRSVGGSDGPVAGQTGWLAGGRGDLSSSSSVANGH